MLAEIVRWFPYVRGAARIAVKPDMARLLETIRQRVKRKTALQECAEQTPAIRRNENHKIVSRAERDCEVARLASARRAPKTPAFEKRNDHENHHRICAAYRGRDDLERACQQRIEPHKQWRRQDTARSWIERRHGEVDLQSRCFLQGSRQWRHRKGQQPVQSCRDHQAVLVARHEPAPARQLGGPITVAVTFGPYPPTAPFQRMGAIRRRPASGLLPNVVHWKSRNARDVPVGITLHRRSPADAGHIKRPSPIRDRKPESANLATQIEHSYPGSRGPSSESPPGRRPAMTQMWQMRRKCRT